MKINIPLLDEVASAGTQVVAVTKYFNPQTTQNVLEKIKDHAAFLALGENRVNHILNKKIDRKYVHFIGNIQSRNIADISNHCAVVHSLDSLSHAQKFSHQELIPSFFIQVNISGEKQKGGVDTESLNTFFDQLPKTIQAKVIGLSGMGMGSFDLTQKQAEFRLLKKLRNKINPDWLISAGTSCDYQIALAEGIDIVRIGSALFEV